MVMIYKHAIGLETVMVREARLSACLSSRGVIQGGGDILSPTAGYTVVPCGLIKGEIVAGFVLQVVAGRGFVPG